jgi:hypothetical protein
MAGALIEKYSKRGDTILDPFSGSGVVALESLLRGRGAFANDINPYAAVLTRAKLRYPHNVEHAVDVAANFVKQAKLTARLRNNEVSAPEWVKQFFHPRTFAELKILADDLRRHRQWFILANLLGIIHHQRPGFLSFPSSHLVPYLRAKQFPRSEYPELYEYRDVAWRLEKNPTEHATVASHRYINPTSLFL